MTTARLFSGDRLEASGEATIAELDQSAAVLSPGLLRDAPAAREALLAAHRPHPPRLFSNRTVFEGGEVEIERFDVLSRIRTHWGLQFSFRIPFEGDARCFDLSAGSPLPQPEGCVKGEDLVLVFTSSAGGREDIPDLAQTRIKEIEAILESQRVYFHRLETDMRKAARTALEQRALRLDRLEQVSLALTARGYRRTPDIPEPLRSPRA